jgi:branched-chain amino acid transport system ATP-binding protein
MVLDFGRKICAGLPEEVMENEQVKTAYLGVGFDDEIQETAGEVV